MIEPGEIYMADFPEAGPRPVIVVEFEEFQRQYPIDFSSLSEEDIAGLMDD